MILGMLFELSEAHWCPKDHMGWGVNAHQVIMFLPII